MWVQIGLICMCCIAFIAILIILLGPYIVAVFSGIQMKMWLTVFYKYHLTKKRNEQEQEEEQK